MAPPTPSRASTSSCRTPPSSAGSAIQVVVRLRPMNDNEKKHGTLPVVTAKTHEKSVTVIKGKGARQMKSSYTFDNVFTAFSSQEEVFEATVKPVISDVMRGFESTVFAYGQTGTGKTHTMEGSLSNPEHYGVIPRSAQAIFEHLKQPKYKEQVVTCSYLEIYNEELRDLLDDGSSKVNEKHNKLEIMESKNGTFCRNLTEKEVKSAEDVLNLMQNAQQQRIVGETKMNKASSRSHCLFTIQVHGTIALLNGDGDMEFFGKLHMVDLAGSECAKSAGNEKGGPNEVSRERERMNINRSLLTLGRVISILKERSENKNNNSRIPYRDSKLTRILQESLGGRCKTVIVATLSPSITAIEESISTLNYAQSANGIMNKPVSSSLISLGESNFATERPKECTVESWQEMEMRLQYMQAQVEEAQAALARKHLQQQEIQERAEKSEAELLESQQQLFNANVEINSLKGVVEVETSKRKQAENELSLTQMELKKSLLILKATQSTEAALTSEAQSLIGALENLVNDRNDLHALIVSQRDVESERRTATKKFQEAALVVLSNVESSFANLCSNIETNQSAAVEIATFSHEIGRRSIVDTQELLADIARNVSCVTNSIKAQLTGEYGIVPNIELSTNAVLDDLKSASNVFTHGENEYEESREATRRKLDECARTLDKWALSMQSTTSHTLQRFETNVAESKNTITSLVEKVKISLSNLSNSKAQMNKATNLQLEQWRAQSLENSKKLHDVSSTNCNIFKKSIEEFQSEMHNHEQISKSLEKQRSFLDDCGSAHVKTIDQQSTVLNAYREKLLNCHKTQNMIRNEVMQSIMSGVNDLVSSEIEKLAAVQMEHFTSLDQGGVDLAATNDKMSLSANQVMSNIQATNQFVSEKASILHSNDTKTCKVMIDTHTILEEVVTSSNTHHQLTSDFASKSLALLSEMKQIDGQSSGIASMVEQEGSAISLSLVTSVLNPTSADVKETIESCLGTLNYVNNDVVYNINKEIDDIAIKRKSVTSQMNNTFQNTNSKLLSMKENVVALANSQNDAAGRLGEDTVSSSDLHQQKTVPYYCAEIDSGKEKLVSSLIKMKESSIQVISEGKAQGAMAKQSIDDFAMNKMKCLDPVAPAPTRRDCKFSDKLSSTPTESEILSGFDFASASCKDVAPPPMVACNTDSPEDDISQGDDSRSRKSSCSQSSVPSPGLRPRDINANHGELASSHKSRKHHRLNVVTSIHKKNKAPSGAFTPSASRKKMKR